VNSVSPYFNELSFPSYEFVQILRDLRRSSHLCACDVMMTEKVESICFLRCVFWRNSQLNCSGECFANVRRTLSQVHERRRSDCHLKLQFARVSTSARWHLFENVESPPEVPHGLRKR